MELPPPPPPMRSVPPPPPPPPLALFHFSDGSRMRRMRASDLVKISIWHGNRILDESHKAKIKEETKGSLKALDGKPYHVVTYKEHTDDGTVMKTVIVDGQHRASVILDHFTTDPTTQDFDVLVVEKFCESESETIQYFKILNSVKSIPWKEDPVLIANRFIQLLMKKFPTKDKKGLFRNGEKTHRPFLSIERLRKECVDRRIGVSTEFDIDTYTDQVVQWNLECLNFLRKKEVKDKMEEKAIELGFALALDPKLKWLNL